MDIPSDVKTVTYYVQTPPAAATFGMTNYFELTDLVDRPQCESEWACAPRIGSRRNQFGDGQREYHRLGE